MTHLTKIGLARYLGITKGVNSFISTVSSSSIWEEPHTPLIVLLCIINVMHKVFQTLFERYGAPARR